MQLRENGRVLETKRVNLPPGQRRQKTTFLLTAPAPGKRRYEVADSAPGRRIYASQ